MTLYHEAINQVHEVAASKRKNLKTEKVSLLSSVSRVSARQILSNEQVPFFDNSAMDGFALRSYETLTATREQPAQFNVLGLIAAGDLPPQTDLSAQSSAFEIMTGAPFPEGYDSCARIEDCEVFRDDNGHAQQVKIHSPLTSKKNLRPAGSDFQVGSKLLEAGEVIRPEHILTLASLGFNEIDVYAPLKVALIATGKELVRFDQKPEQGQIRNSTQPYLQYALEQPGNQVETFLINQDSPKDFNNLLQKLSDKNFDLIISTGAVSMGQFDFVADVLKELDAKIYFHKIAIRPGKPILFAELPTGSVVFSLPGNPVSSVIGLRFFVDSFLTSLFSKTPEKPMRAKLKQKFEKPAGLKCFLKAKLDLSEDGAQVEILESQMSSQLSSLVEANVWAILDEDQSHFEKNAFINLYPIRA